MRKKCVQLWQKHGTTLWESRLFTQPRAYLTRTVGKYRVQPDVVRAMFHNLFSQNYSCYATDLSLVSTEPTITTICLKNKNHNNKTRG